MKWWSKAAPKICKVATSQLHFGILWPFIRFEICTMPLPIVTKCISIYGTVGNFGTHQIPNPTRFQNPSYYKTHHETVERRILCCDPLLGSRSARFCFQLSQNAFLSMLQWEISQPTRFSIPPDSKTHQILNPTILRNPPDSETHQISSSISNYL